jgi:hypothetical protein
VIFIRLLFVAILAFPAAATAQQQNVSKQDVVRLLEKLQLEQNNPDALEGLGFRGEKLDLMLDHGQKLAQNRVILEFMADKLIGAQSGAQPADALGGLMTPLLRRGMPYLPIKEQRYFLNVEFTVMQAMNTTNCGRSVKETIAPQVFARSLAITTARLNAPALKEYLRVVRKASTTGVSKPKPPRMSEATKERVLERFATKLQDKAAEKGLSRAFARADVSLRQLSNREACQLGLLFVETVLDTTGADQRPMLQLFWRDFQ